MSRFLHYLPVAVATVATTELIFRLSGFRYGQGSVFAQPFNLVLFTVKMLWWFGAWFFFTWLFGRLGTKRLKQ